MLDENTNRGYGNNSFFKKRGEIINILRTGKRKKSEPTDTERYIPIGTKWVFLKAFSDLDKIEKASIHYIWDGEEEYKKDLINQLWTLQSGLKIVSGKPQYFVYDDKKGLVQTAPGLVIDKDGKYYFFASNADGKISNLHGEIDINGIDSNGLVSEGKYDLGQEGKLELIKTNDVANEV